MPRHKRKLSSIATYHVVIKGADRQLLFEEKKDYKKYLEFLKYYKEKYHFEIYAYCLMSNHVHLIIHHPATTTLEQIFRSLNARYAIWYNSKYDRTGFVQDGRYYSEPIEEMDYLFRAIRYVHCNPLKAGLEDQPGSTYPWSSYYDYLRKKTKLTDTAFFLSLIGSTDAFSEFHGKYPQEENEFLDIEQARKRLLDDVAKEIIHETCNCSNVTEFQKLPLSKRDKYLFILHEKGISIRQLNRLTGTPRGVIERLLKNPKEFLLSL